MRSPRIVPVLCATVCLLVGGGLALGLVPSRTLADTPRPSPSPSPSCTVSPSPSPSPSPSASPTASPQLVSWASGWHRVALRARVRLVRLRACLGRGRLCALPHRPSGDEASGWAAFGARCKRLDYRWCTESRRDWRRIVDPQPLRSAVQWRPLLRYVGWPSYALSDAVTCIRRESGGRPWASNPSGCRGLFQLNTCWWAGKFNPYDPEANARCALQIWRREGWRPWTSVPELW